MYKAVVRRATCIVVFTVSTGIRTTRKAAAICDEAKVDVLEEPA